MLAFSDLYGVDVEAPKNATLPAVFSIEFRNVGDDAPID